MEVSGLIFVCIYAPSGDQKKLNRNIHSRPTVQACVTKYKTPAIVQGDINAIGEFEDRKSGKLTAPKTDYHNQNPLEIW